MRTGECQLKDGRTVVLRTAAPGDAPSIARLFMELSPESFLSRFHSGGAGPTVVSRLARVDTVSGTVCVVAAMTDDPGSLAAEARYVPMGPGAAELGLTVLDGYQGNGLGHLLLGALVERARDSGLERLRAVVSLSNAPMLHLLEPCGWALAGPTDLGVACLEISVIGGMPGWPADVAGRKVLVEQRGWFETEQVAALRSAGNDVRQCPGPRRITGRTCPLLTSGHCRLAQEADVIMPLLPGDEEDCAHLIQAHRWYWPDRLAV
jgi:GNAT superfamily N-acetyltransferase